MSILRGEDLWTVAYFLSRCGHRPDPDRPPGPPSQLGVTVWREAYELFFDSLAAGRTETAFRNSLKNARDLFDGHLDSGRVGWREDGRERLPQPLGTTPSAILTRWSQRSDSELWGYVSQFSASRS